ncbi:zinc ABC transporter substrate-binding protein [Candidatus Pantoea edessiphila]|uniref:High-affinity zinc uptake system protein ZnuA n=1 Tax=Candidatus Pantoea edessiphila TaxID=2044610 RepID=A0A2P5T2S1_9GAMM|nr:zinc ABC transporter substrate-binding protein ZnuA [Candidatus Pantoea edessiphila]PPI88852.1 zinc ABC transporter substrate-binding protein [Candidatus Pantoea edessiphila]
MTKKIFILLINLVLSNLIVLSIYANVVVSIKPIGFIAAAIIGNIMPIDVIVPDGASEHSYMLRPSDEKKLKDTNLLIWNGAEIEPFMAKSVNNIPNNKIIVIPQIQGIKRFFIQIKKDNYNYNIINKCNKDINTNLSNKQYNMHFWTSPDIAKTIAIAIHEKLLKLMPENKIILNNNLEKFKKSLDNIDNQIMKQLRPIKDKGYFVFHDAYVYFEKHYGLAPLGYFTINPDIQPGVKHLYEIKKKLKEKKVVCVFSEPQFKPAVIDSITKDVKINKGVLDPLGSDIRLSKDSYLKFLLQLSNQYKNCLLKDSDRNKKQ